MTDSVESGIITVQTTLSLIITNVVVDIDNVDMVRVTELVHFNKKREINSRLTLLSGDMGKYLFLYKTIDKTGTSANSR